MAPPIPRLTLQLLGSLTILADDQELTAQLSRKTRALVAYLAATERAHSRRSLYDMFCQRASDPPGALRWHLSRIRKHLGAKRILTDGSEITWNTQSTQVDCLIFDQALSPTPTEDLNALEAALQRYQGPFLDNLHLPDSPAFELWQLGQRAYFESAYERGLLALLTRYIELENFSTGIETARKLLNQNPLLEEAHGQLIWLYARTGQRQAALKQFESCRKILQDELAVQPAPELRALNQQVLAGEIGHRRRVVLPPIPTSPQPNPQTFVGREPELAALRAAWEKVRQGNGPVVLVEAEAGGGKTRFVQEFARLTPEIHLITGRCYETARAFPYRPWVDLLDILLGDLNEKEKRLLAQFWKDQLVRLHPSLAMQLDIPGPRAPSSARGPVEQLFSAVTEVLTLAAKGSPYLIFLDDLQWADEASLRLLLFVAQRLSARSQRDILLVGSYRKEEVDNLETLQTTLADLRRGPVLNLPLEPLDRAAIVSLISSLWSTLPKDSRPMFAEMLRAAAKGNPFFITEVLHELSQAPEPPEKLPVPQSVRGLIQRRLSRLPDSGRQVIEALAVLGAPANLTEIQKTSARSEDEVISAIDLGLRRNLLEAVIEDQPPRYNFRHDLVQEAVVRSLTVVRRTVLHRRAAQALETSGESPPRLAYHWGMAGEQNKEAEYSLLAGEHAAAGYANDDAILFLQRAWDLSHNPRVRIRILLKLGEVRQHLGDWAQAEADYRRIIAMSEAAGDHPARASALAALGRLLIQKGQYDNSQRILATAARAYTQLGDPIGRSAVVGHMGLVYWYQGHYDEAMAAFQERYNLAMEHDDKVSASIAQANMGLVHWSLGDLEQALHHYEQKLAFDQIIGDRLSMSKALLNIGLVYRDLGDYPGAINRYIQKYLIDNELGDRLGVALALENLGDLLNRYGDYERAQDCLLLSLKIALELNSLQVMSVALGRLGLSLRGLGSLEKARQVLGWAITLSREIQTPRNLCAYLQGLSELSFRLGQYTEAEAFNEAALETAIRVNRKDVHFRGEILRIRIQHALKKLNIDESTAAIEMLLEAWPRPAERAFTHLNLWQLDPGRDRNRSQALEMYRELAKNTPDAAYRVHYQTLSGAALPDPQPLPELPAELESKKPDPAGLFDQVRQLLDNLGIPSEPGKSSPSIP